MSEAYSNYTISHFGNQPYVAYNLLKSCSSVIITSFILYSVMIFSLNNAISLVIFLGGSITSLAIVLSIMKRFGTKINDDNVKNGFRNLVIGQLIAIIIDIIIAIFLLVFFIYTSSNWDVTDSLVKSSYIVFEIVYFVRYIFIGYSFYAISIIHTKMVGNFSYKNRRLFTGFFSYPIILLKFIFYNSDALIIEQCIIGNGFVLNANTEPMFLVLFIIHIVLAAVFLAFLIETSIKFRLVTQKIIDTDKHKKFSTQE